MSARHRTAGHGLGLISLLILASLPVFGQQEPEKRGGPEGGRDNPAARAAWFLRGRTVKGKSSAELLFKAHQQKLLIRQQTLDRLRLKAARTSQMAPAPGSGTTGAVAPGGGQPMTVPSGPAWTSLGPAPIANFGYGDASGRITAIAVDQTDSTGNTVFVAGAYGGVWKSTNAANGTPGNVSWTPLFDNDPAAVSLSVGAIALQPGNPSLILVGTGEANSSGDSYYGQGILRSTDGGSSWTLVSSADSGAHPFRGLGFSKIAFSTANTSLVVAGAAGTIGNGLGAELPGVARGLYYSTDAGATWHQASVKDGSTTIAAGSATSVVYNASAGAFFAAIRFHGFYTSTDGINWTRLTTQPLTSLSTAACPSNTGSSGCPIFRGEIAVKPGANEMYVWYMNFNSFTFAETNQGVFKTTTGGGSWITVTRTGIDSCGDPAGCGVSQGSYNLFLAAVPNGTNTDLYAGAINIFKCSVLSSATTALCNATTGANRWLNLTHVYGYPGFGGTCSNSYVTIHPDEHAVAFSESDPNIMYFGNDGGMYRTLTSKTGLVNGTCTSSSSNPFQDLNTSSLGSLTQFISISQHPTKDTIVLGGTQDNGSPGMSTGDGQTSGATWGPANGGDGGYNEIDQVDPKNWYTTNTDVSIQKCVGGTNLSPPFPGADPESACILNDFFNSIVTNATVGGDGGAFYTPYILDPQNQAKLIVGTCRVWRGNNDGSSFTALSPDFEPGGTLPCSGNETNVVRSLAAGGPVVSGVSSVIYAGTDRDNNPGGHIWVSTNAGSGSPTWTDTTGSINPNGFPISKIALDPTDSTGQTAYITIMGFTGGGGHVFKTTNAGGAWTDISASLVDAPADSVVVDPIDPTIIYVGTDVGVFATNDNGTTWSEYGTGFPNVAVLALRAFSSGNSHKLRAGTHGRGVWSIDLASSLGPDYSLNITNPSATVEVPPGFTGTFNGKLIARNNYASNVTITCVATPGPLPNTCTPPGSPVTPSSPGTDFTVSASNPSQGTFNFKIKGVGADVNTITHDTAVTLKVTDFTIVSTTPSPIIEQTGSGTHTVTLTGQNSYGGTVHLSCANFTSSPSELSCTFSQNDFTPSGGGGTAVTVTVNATANATVASGQTFDVVAADLNVSHSKNLGYSIIFIQDFTFTGSTPPQTVLGGNTGNFTGTLTPLNSFGASITLSCSALAGAACVFTPASGVAIGSQIAQGLAIDITTTAGTTPTGSSIVTVTASGGGKTHTLPVTLNVQNFTLSVSPTTRTVGVGGGSTYTVTVTGQNGFTGLVTLGCNAPPTGVTCSFSPAAVNPGTPSTLTVTTASNITAGTKTISVTGTSGGQTRSAANISLIVSTTAASFTLTNSTPTKTAQVGSSTTFTLNVKSTIATSPGVVTMSCVAPLPTGVGCSFVPASLTPTTTGTNVTATVTTTSGTPVAANPITFQGATTSQFKRVSGTLQVTDYSLGVSPASRVLGAPVGTTTYTVTLTSLDGFNSAVSLTCPQPPLPTGWTCGFNPTPVTPTGGGATSTLTLTTTATPFGSTDFTVQGSGGSPALVRSQSVNVINGTNDYFFSAAQPLVAVRPGQTAGFSVDVTRYGTYNKVVNLSCVGTMPTGANCSVLPTSVDLNTVSSGQSIPATVSITTTSGSTPPADTAFMLHGDDGAGDLKDQALTLRVNDFSISSTTPQQTIEQGNSKTYAVTVTGLNSYGSTVDLSCANLTVGVTCSFTPNAFVPLGGGGTSVTLTLSAAGNATVVSSQTFDIVANDGANSHSVSRSYDVVLVQDFTFTGGTTAQTVVPGATGNFTGTLMPQNQFADSSTALSCSGLPTGAACVFTPASGVAAAIGGGTPVPLAIDITTNGTTTPAGTSIVTVTASGTDNITLTPRTHSIPVTLTVQDFTLSVSPTTRTVAVGAGTTYTVTLAAQNGFPTPVTLSCPAPPTGVTCSFAPNPAGPAGTSIATVQTASNITVGAKTVSISGTAVGRTKSMNVTLTVSSTTASFTLSSTALTKTAVRGAAATYTVTVKSTTTTSPGTVTLSCVPPLPTGVTCSFSPASVSPTTTGVNSTATLSTNVNTATASSNPIVFKGTTTSQLRQLNATLNIADFSVGVSPSSQTISSVGGGSTNYTVTLTALGGVTFPSAVTLSCPPPPTGVTCTTFVPASVTPTGGGATSTLTLTTTGAAAPGPINFTVQGASGTLLRTQIVEVINGLDFTLSATTPITVNQSSNNTTTVNAAAIGTFASSVALSCSSLPAGFSCGFVPTSITPGTPSTLTISADNTVAGGIYIITVQGQSSSPSLTHTTNVTVNVPDFTVGLTGASNTVFRGQDLPLNGTATAIAGYASSVPFTCSTGDANAPCVASTPVTPTGVGAAVTVTVSPNGSATTGPHTVTLTGNDGAGHVHSATFNITVQEFAVAATDANLSTEAGAASGTYSGSVTGTSFTGNVVLSCSSPSITVTCAFSPSATIAASGGTPYTFTITPDPAATVGGPYVVTVTGTVGSVTRTATVNITVLATQDWGYSYHIATPQSQTVNAGQSASYDIDLSPNNGFASSVALTCAVLTAPAGVGCSITGSPLTPPGTITLNVTTTSGTVAAGSYSIVVSGTSGVKTRTTTASLTVRDFSLSVTPPTQSVAPGATADYNVSISTTSGFPDNATLTCAVLTSPTGTGCSFDGSPLAPGGFATLHVSSTGATPAASYTVQVTATSGSTVHSSNVTFTVASPNDFTLTTSTPSLSINHGAFATAIVTVTATGTFAESVTLSCTGLPTGVSCFPPAAFVPPTSGINKNINVFVSSTAVPGAYSFQIKGTSATKNHSVSVNLTIN